MFWLDKGFQREREAGQLHQAEKKEHNRDASGRSNLQALEWSMSLINIT